MPPIQWSDTKNVKWKVEIPGRGSGSPVIWEDKVFVVTAVRSDGKVEEVQPNQRGQGGGRQRGRQRGGGGSAGPLPQLRFKLLCFDRNDGDLLWEKTATEATPHEGAHSTNNFASASPCTDGKHVYAHFWFARAVLLHDGWRTGLETRRFGENEQTRAGFGEGSSPILAGDKIIVPWDHEGPSFLFALDKLTGETVWKTPRDEPTSWATPLAVEHDGKIQIVMNGENKARSYDAESGKEIWSCGGQTQRPCASAVAGDGLVFIGSGHRGAFLGAFQLDGKGDIGGTEKVVWTVNRDTPDIASPLLSDGRLYFHKGKNRDSLVS